MTRESYFGRRQDSFLRLGNFINNWRSTQDHYIITCHLGLPKRVKLAGSRRDQSSASGGILSESEPSESSSL